MIRRLLAGLMAIAALCLAARLLPSSERLAPAISAAGVTRFENVAQPAGLEMTPLNGASPDKHLVETMGSGGVFFDMDGDGWVDIFLVDGGSVADPAVARRARHRLYKNRGNGAFEDVTAASGIVPRGYGQGACAADIDNDGLIDLYVTGFTENALYRNRGRGRFQDATRQAGVAAGQWSTSCAFADVDRDGFVDLFVTRYVDAGMRTTSSAEIPHAACASTVIRSTIRA
jgi:hypothetical protein